MRNSNSPLKTTVKIFGIRPIVVFPCTQKQTNDLNSEPNRIAFYDLSTTPPHEILSDTYRLAVVGFISPPALPAVSLQALSMHTWVFTRHFN